MGLTLCQRALVENYPHKDVEAWVLPETARPTVLHVPYKLAQQLKFPLTSSNRTQTAIKILGALKGVVPSNMPVEPLECIILSVTVVALILFAIP